MATWDEQNYPSFKTAARGFEPGFTRSHNTNNGFIIVVVFDPIVIYLMATFSLNELSTTQAQGKILL